MIVDLVPELDLPLADSDILLVLLVVSMLPVALIVAVAKVSLPLTDHVLLFMVGDPVAEDELRDDDVVREVLVVSLEDALDFVLLTVIDRVREAEPVLLVFVDVCEKDMVRVEVLVAELVTAVSVAEYFDGDDADRERVLD